MRRIVLAVLALAIGAGSFGLGYQDAAALRGWCRRDPPIRLYASASGWRQGNVGADVYGEVDESWADGDTWITVNVPDAVSQFKYQDDAGVWQSVDAETWYVVGDGFGGYTERIKFHEVAYLQVFQQNGIQKIEIEISIVVNANDPTLDLRFYSKPKGQNIKYSDPIGTTGSPPGLLYDKLVEG